MTSPSHSQDILMLDTSQFKAIDLTPSMQDEVEWKFIKKNWSCLFMLLSIISVPKAWNFKVKSCTGDKVIVFVESPTTHICIHKHVDEEIC